MNLARALTFVRLLWHAVHAFAIIDEDGFRRLFI